MITSDNHAGLKRHGKAFFPPSPGSVINFICSRMQVPTFLKRAWTRKRTKTSEVSSICRADKRRNICSKRLLKSMQARLQSLPGGSKERFLKDWRYSMLRQTPSESGKSWEQQNEKNFKIRSWKNEQDVLDYFPTRNLCSESQLRFWSNWMKHGSLRASVTSKVLRGF